MIAVTGRVWIAIRLDGVELGRVEAYCFEVARSNGVATFETAGPVVFPDFPTDLDWRTEALVTVHDGENLPPFQAAPLRATVNAGESAMLTKVTFQVLLDLPKHVRAEK